MTSRRRETAARRRNKETGSPPPGEPVFLLVGILRKPHGIHGEMLMAVMTDFPERITAGSTLLVGPKVEPLTVKHVRHHNKGMLIRFEEHTGMEDIETWRNVEVFVRADDRPPLPEGEFYLHELIGARVVADTGEEVGVLSEVLETGANRVYIVRDPEGREILLPAIDDVILDVDLAAKQIKVHLLEGLN